jgi:arylsulfatase A-like enzyme
MQILHELSAKFHKNRQLMRTCYSKNQRRRAALFVMIAWCLVIGDFQVCAAGQRSPNVVMILADDLGAHDLVCYGADLHETPNLDRFAASGVRFTQAYAASPVCTPTRASIMTGKYPARLKMTIWHEASANPPRNRKLIPPITRGNLPLGEVTLAEVLKSRGYVTAHIGKWHLGDAAHYPQNQGFDLNIGGTFWGAPPTFFYPYSGPFGRAKEPRYVPHLWPGQPGEYLTDRLTDEAIRFIKREREHPFFLHLAYHTVHTPIEAKAASVAKYQAKLDARFHHQNATYAAMVGSLDENVGRLLKQIEDLGLTDDTVVIFNSDNGGFINSHRDMPMVTSNAPLRSGKGSLYEGGVRVPLMVRWPGVTKAGSECRRMVSSIDFLPTILEITATSDRSPAESAIGEIDGQSLVPLLKDASASFARDELFFHYPHYYPTTTPVSSVRRGDWKLIEFYESDRIELYDLSSDPGEKTDLAADKPKTVRELHRRLRAWRTSVDAQLPKPNPDFARN